MEKRYQVFVSSTYTDLADHRRAVIEALMGVNAFPVGMELFPAADDDAWTVIKRVIDESDYYLVIIGGKYGSIDKDGTSFTEKEYDYAVSKGKPVVAFLHGDPDSIPRGDSETDPSLNQKLDAFRDKAKKKLCRFWANREELITAVLISFQHLVVNSPAMGWVRAEHVKTGEDAAILADLQKRISQLHAENAVLHVRLDEANSTAAKKASSSATGLPQFAVELITACRKARTEWEVEKAVVENTQRGTRVLGMMYDRLLELLIQIDDTKHLGLTHQIRYLLQETRKFQSGQSPIRNPSEFWSRGGMLLAHIQGLEHQIRNEKWEIDR